MKIIGFNLKRIREERNLSLRDIAKKIDISPSFLSQIENGKTNPSVATLKAIADALSTTIAALMGEEVRADDNYIIRESERKSIGNLGNGIKIHLLTSHDPYKQMEPLFFTFESDASSGDTPYQHYGQEFLLVLSGSIELMLNSTRYVLRKGDTMYFNSNMPHSYRNIDKDKTEVVWVVTPPSF
jgi:transcriptional regulator with XRE-family HTH domain